MKATIQRLTASLIEQARVIANDAERLPADCGISGAECVIALADAQRGLRRAQDALRLAITQQTTGDDGPLFSELKPWTK